jgi:hypothetical protein
LSRLLGGEPIQGSLTFHDFVNLVEGYADTKMSSDEASSADICNGSSPEMATTVPSSDASSQTDKNGSFKEKDEFSPWRPNLWNARERERLRE